MTRIVEKKVKKSFYSLLSSILNGNGALNKSRLAVTSPKSLKAKKSGLHGYFAQCHGWWKQHVCLKRRGNKDLLRQYPQEEHHLYFWWKTAAERRDFKELGKWCLPGFSRSRRLVLIPSWTVDPLPSSDYLTTLQPSLVATDRDASRWIFFHLKFTSRLMRTWQMTAQMQNGVDAKQEVSWLLG